MVLETVLFPLLMAALALLVRSNRLRPWLLPVAGVGHALLTLRALSSPPSPAGWLGLDAPGKLVLGSVSLLFLLCGFYTVGYLRHRLERPNRVFCAALCALLGMLSLVTVSRHLGALWVATEATALLTAPLIYFNHTPRSIEATWKYLLMGSIGIALALLGTFFLAYASAGAGLGSSLSFDFLVRVAPGMTKTWLRAGFVLLLVGYGTKMGLAPMHTWKPDAYGEAPGVVGALMAGGVTSCAFLAIMRVTRICTAAGEALPASRLLIVLGLFSVGLAAALMIGQRDFKRLLAYSSVEHMGVLALGLGIGGAALFATLLHLVSNALVKGVLFLSAGNIHRAYGEKTTDSVSGALRRLPLSGAMFLAGFLALAGSPPFVPFRSLFGIVVGAFAGNHSAAGALLLVWLLIVFIGMGATVMKVVQGAVPATERGNAYREGWLTGLPPLLLLALALLLGIWLPAPLMTLLRDAVHYLGGAA